MIVQETNCPEKRGKVKPNAACLYIKKPGDPQYNGPSTTDWHWARDILDTTLEDPAGWQQASPFVDFYTFRSTDWFDPFDINSTRYDVEYIIDGVVTGDECGDGAGACALKQTPWVDKRAAHSSTVEYRFFYVYFNDEVYEGDTSLVINHETGHVLGLCHKVNSSQCPSYDGTWGTQSCIAALTRACQAVAISYQYSASHHRQPTGCSDRAGGHSCSPTANALATVALGNIRVNCNFGVHKFRQKYSC